MEKVVAAFPVLPGKDAKDVARIFAGRDAEYAESRRRQGMHMERVYQQATPMGTFVVAYFETDRPYGESVASVAESDLPIDREFVAGLKEVHGFDPAQPPPGELPEILGDWVDDTATERKRGLAFVAPVMPGADAIGRAFAKEAFETRRAEHEASRRALGLTHETVVLNHTPGGDVICVYLEGDDPIESNRRFAEATDSYNTWFKDRCKEIFPPEVDFNQPLPPIEQILDSEKALVAH